MKRIDHYLRALIVLGFLFGSTAATAAEENRLDRATAGTVIDSLARTIVDHYVEADRAVEIAGALSRAFPPERMAELNTSDRLANALTTFLTDYDRHFSVWRQPPSPNTDRTTEDNTADSARRQALLARANYGFHSVRMLDGNVGYLDLRQFADPHLAGQTATAAMGFLAHSDAVIIDLRYNGGGWAEMVQLLSSYFLGPEPVQYNALYERRGDHTRQLWTLPHVAGPRLLDQPLYILISARTGSAAESMAYSLQALDRAVVVGESSAGAANPGDIFPLAHGFQVFVSTGKAVNPVTGSNWEGSGVSPDVSIHAADALERAHQLALERLLADQRQGDFIPYLQFARDRVLTRGPVLKADQGLAGRYGDRVISVDHQGYLQYQRGRRPAFRLLAGQTDDHYFLTVRDNIQLIFERDERGHVTALAEAGPDGQRRLYERSDRPD